MRNDFYTNMRDKIREGYIYMFTNKVNGKMYVGQTICRNQRYIQHLKEDSLLGKAIRKYGIENFKYEDVFHLIGEKNSIKPLLDDLERYYIKKYDTKVPNGYNISVGGQSWCPNDAYTESRSEKISNALKAHYVVNTHWRTGTHLSEESKKKLSESHKGKRKGERPWNYGLHLEKYRGLMTNRLDQSKPVLQYDLEGNFIKEYPSIAEAARQTGFLAGNIGRVCRGTQKYCHDYVFAFKYK